MKNMENPASKLLVILERAYKTTSRHFGKVRYKTVWAEVFNVDETDLVSLMNNVVGMINLLNETKELIEQNERLNSEKNQKFMQNIERAILTVDIEGGVDVFKDNINQETLTALYYIAEFLNLTYDLNESKVDNEKISELINEINDLINSITESLLPKDVQDILVDNLINIKNALYRYRFLGEEELRKALEQTIGSVAVNKELIDKNQDNFIYPRIGGVLGNVSSLITIGTAIKDYLLPFFDKLLR